MRKTLQIKNVLVYDSGMNYVGKIRASSLSAEPIEGCTDSDDLQEAINLVRRPKVAKLTVYDKITGQHCRYYYIEKHRPALRKGFVIRATIGSDECE